MKIKSILSLVLAAIAATPAFAQLAAPNDAGVSMHHVLILTTDRDAQLKFWNLFGAPSVIHTDKLDTIQFPNALLLEKGEPTGGSVGSSINHIGFYVHSVNDYLPGLRAAGYEVEQKVALPPSSTGLTRFALS